MNLKNIWAIIILMSLAMLGSIFIQFYWINGNIKESEKQFKAQIHDALNQVAERLDRDEQDNFMGLKELTQPLATPTLKIDLSASRFLSDSSKHRGGQWNSLAEKISNTIELNTPLVERIDRDKLSTYLQSELENRGIDLEYTYAVYDTEEESIVIKDGFYTVSSDSAPASDAEVLVKVEGIDYKYQVNLFVTLYGPKGLLMLHFPNEVSLYWSNIWRTVVASIFFTLLILFCFFYSINVIYRQKKLSEMKTDFINNMTHEFKTPIATISLASDSIKSKTVINKPERVIRFADIIKEENHRLLNQVEKVLQMALLEKGDFKLKVSEVNLNEIVRKAVEHTSLQVKKRGGVVSTELSLPEAIVEGDATHLSNIVYNLLDNANKYSPEKPHIIIRTYVKNDGVELMIEDNGIGMSKDDRKHIFDKFYRVHTGNRHDVKGFGLGLSYVKTMVDAHHGDISVKSELGKGSSFIIFLPVKQAA